MALVQMCKYYIQFIKETEKREMDYIIYLICNIIFRQQVFGYAAYL